MATPYHGRKGAAYISISGSASASLVALLNSWSLNRETDYAETTAFGDTNKTYVQGLPDISGELSGFWDSDSDALYDGSISSDGVKIYLYPSTDAPSKYFYGPAWLDVSFEVPNDEAATISATFKAKSAWGQM